MNACQNDAMTGMNDAIIPIEKLLSSADEVETISYFIIHSNINFIFHFFFLLFLNSQMNQLDNKIAAAKKLIDDHEEYKKSEFAKIHAKRKANDDEIEQLM